MTKFLAIKHAKVTQANAFSSPYTAGFPAVTSFLGFSENLSRRLNATSLSDAAFSATAVISHGFDLKTVQKGWYLAPTASANPPGKDGQRPSFIPEVHCDMDVSLILQMEKGSSLLNIDHDPLLKEQVLRLLLSTRLASGIIEEVDDIVPFVADAQEPDTWKPLLMNLMPGFALLDRHSLIREEVQKGKDAMDALLDYCSIPGDFDSEVQNPRLPEKSGWIVPIAVGYQGISELSLQAANTRDPKTPHRFAEAVVSLGEFKMIHRIKDFSEIFWTSKYKEESGLYLCEQGFINY
jgi:CRISPR-associated protein Csy2